MSLRNRLVLPFILATLAALAGCGSSTHRATPPPTGGFSNSNLSGTYVFSIIGSDTSGLPLQLTGTLTANGSGGITGGTFDVNNPQGPLGTGFLDVNSGSTYHVTVDGRGTATVNTNAGKFGFAFVLTSSEHGMITEFDNGGTGSGSLDLQATVSQTQLAQSYALNLTGTSSGLSPLATLAGFTLDGAGNMSSGIQDFNDSGNSTSLTALPLSGSVLLGAAGAPGTAQLVTSTSLGTLTFDVFAIDANHLKFIEIDSAAFLMGDAFPQLTSVPTGVNVFTAAGSGTVAAAVVPFVAGGFIVTDGNGNVTSASSEDLNEGGVVTPGIGFSGLYDTTLVDGSTTLTLIGFNNANLISTTTFVAYPSVGGLQLLEIDSNGITSGVAMLQSNSSLASGQGYGLNLTGVNSSGEEDDIAEFTNTSGNFSGLVDFNDLGTLTGNRAFSGTYTADSPGTGRGQVASSAFNLITYVVDSSTTLFIEQDTNQVGLGAFQLQNASAKSNLAARHLSVLKLKGSTKFAKGTLKRR